MKLTEGERIKAEFMVIVDLSLRMGLFNSYGEMEKRAIQVIEDWETHIQRIISSEPMDTPPLEPKKELVNNFGL